MNCLLIFIHSALTPIQLNKKTTRESGIKRFLKILGPGLITGASDDDPSGIITYTQAGAGFKFATLWTALITFPLMAAIQGMCARIGMVTEEGLSGILRKHYPRVILYIMMLFSFPAILLNIGADIQGMGAVANLLLPRVPAWAFSIIFTGALLFVIIKYPYGKITRILKWLCITLFLYMIVPFMVHADWKDIGRHTLIPTFHADKEYLLILVAILGTTISPYLFFWQATMEAEDMKHEKKVMVNKRILSDMTTDVNTGMLFSNLVMFFMIVTTGAVLYKAGVRDITSIDQAAKALEPLTGKLTYILFSLGVLGTGFLAIPVLAGSMSYVLAEAFNWQQGLDKKFQQAKGFYISIIIALLVGLLLEFSGISPVHALLYTAVLYGLTAPVMIVIIIHICNNKKIMGKHTNTTLSNVLGVLTFILMLVSAVALVYYQFK